MWGLKGFLPERLRPSAPSSAPSWLPSPSPAREASSTLLQNSQDVSSSSQELEDDDDESTVDLFPRLPPYLDSRTLLPLSVLSPPILGLIILLTSLLLLSTQANLNVASAKKEIMAGCNAAQNALVSLKAIPDVLEQKSQEATVAVVEKSVRGVGSALIVAITILEAVLSFLIDSYRSTYLCALELLVFGALAIVIGAVEEIQGAITASLVSIRTLIQSQVATANGVVQTAISGFNKVVGVFGVDALSVEPFSIPALSSLENVTVGTGIENSLRSLSTSLPTLNDVREKLDSFIDTPFNAMVDKINSTTGNFTFTFDASTKPASTAFVTAAGSDICSGLDLSFIDDIADSLNKIVSTAIGLIVASGVIIILILLYLERRRCRSLVERIRAFQLEHQGTNFSEQELFELVQVSQHGYFGFILWRGVGRSRRLGPSAKRRGKWFISLITHPLALAPLLIGVLGLVACGLQIAALEALSDRAASLTTASLNNMDSQISAQLNVELHAQGAAYAARMNARIAEVQTFLDDELFGEWVNTTAVVLNTTLVEFYDLIERGINATLGDTILAPPVNTFFFCILGSKIEKLQNAITWIHDNAHFTLPTISNDILFLSDDSISALVTPISAAAVGSGGEDDGVTQRLISSFLKGLRQSMILHGIYVGLWIAVVIAGLITMAWTTHVEDQDRRRANGTFVKPRMLWPFARRSRLVNDASSNAPQMAEKVLLVRSAFPSPFRTPLPTPISAPRALSHSQRPSPAYHQMSGGQAKSSPYPWVVRSPPRGVESAPPDELVQRKIAPLTSLGVWGKRIASRVGLPGSSTSGRITSDPEPSPPSSPRQGLQPFKLNPSASRRDPNLVDPVTYSLCAKDHAPSRHACSAAPLYAAYKPLSSSLNLAPSGPGPALTDPFLDSYAPPSSAMGSTHSSRLGANSARKNSAPLRTPFRPSYDEDAF